MFYACNNELQADGLAHFPRSLRLPSLGYGIFLQCHLWEASTRLYLLNATHGMLSDLHLNVILFLLLLLLVVLRQNTDHNQFGKKGLITFYRLAVHQQGKARQEVKQEPRGRKWSREHAGVLLNWPILHGWSVYSLIWPRTTRPVAPPTVAWVLL